MTTTIEVVPVEGRNLPLEAAPKRRVDRQMSVPNTAYYRRAIARGDIARAPVKSVAKKAPPE